MSKLIGKFFGVGKGLLEGYMDPSIDDETQDGLASMLQRISDHMKAGNTFSVATELATVEQYRLEGFSELEIQNKMRDRKK